MLSSVTIDGPVYGIFWDAPDKILVGYAGAVSEFTSTNTEPAEEATFTGTLPEGSGELYGIYPAESDNTVDADGTFKIIYHNEQTAVEGSYDPIAFPSIAVSESKNLSFKNILGLLELTVGYDDVTSITFTAYSDVAIPRTRGTADPIVMYVQLKEGEPTIVGAEGGENGHGRFSGYILNAPKGSSCFTKDAPYYLAVPPISGWTEDMYPLFILQHSDGSTTNIKFDYQPVLERSKVHKVKKLVTEEPSDPYNGHEYVDLGLPSDLKWATCNIGADSPEGFGDYFAWGETAPKDKYSWDTYLWTSFPDGVEVAEDDQWKYVSKYTFEDGRTSAQWYNSSGEFIGDGKTSYSEYNYADDPARKIWKGTWRTPSPEDFKELLDNTTVTSIKDYEGTGVPGYLFTAINGNTLFLPCAGFYYDTVLDYIGEGFYWASSLDVDFSECAQILQMSGAVWLDLWGRFEGLSVRPVAD